ncbi:endonuclease/exonuclease/phosphatase family protein [Microbacterium sp. Se63.02b]|uniref:endonuclease/exonuclease/phosphatase family protein n=1 Tax=Microbacterium sp. Se63.02b TaxID=2709304 RepID=UPI0031F698E1
MDRRPVPRRRLHPRRRLQRDDRSHGFSGVEGGDMGYCRDVASRTGSGLAGTWPSSLPALAGAPIDHVMASQNWTPTGSVVLDDAGGSDHRALVVQLEPAG